MRVVTSLMDITAEEIAGMYKSRWAIESFFRWIKQNLNVPVLFGITKKMRCSINYSLHSLPLFYSSFFKFKEVRRMAVNPYHWQALVACLFVMPCHLNGGLA